MTGHVWITKAHLEMLEGYASSPRRLARVALAKTADRNVLFLTRFGNRYTSTTSEKSSAINVEMHSLRRKGLAAGIKALSGFYFHQTRCTFATNLAGILIPIAGATNALALIKEALLHKDESTSLQYIKFVEQTPVKVASANAFTREFLGIMSNKEGKSNE